MVLTLARIGAFAQTMPADEISSRALWFIHIDAEKFKASQIGRFFTNTIMEGFITAGKQKLGFDAGPIFRNLRSATAYGLDGNRKGDDRGILILKSAPDAVQSLQQYLTEQTMAEKGPRVEKIEAEGSFFRIEKELCAAVLNDGVVVIGKAEPDVKHALAVLKGTEPGMKGSKFHNLLQPQGGFLIAAVGSGFNQAALGIPQAKVLQNAKGLGLALNEKEEQLILNLALQLENDEVALQVKAIAQGLLAFASLEKGSDKELKTVLQSAQITSKGSTLFATVEFPVQQAIDKINDVHGHKNSKKTRPANP